MSTVYLRPVRTWIGGYQTLATNLLAISRRHQIQLTVIATYVLSSTEEDLGDDALDGVDDGEETCATRW